MTHFEELLQERENPKAPLNPLTALLYRVPDAIDTRRVQEIKDLEHTLQNTQRKRKRAAKRRAHGLTRDELQAAERARWLDLVLEVLGGVESMTTVELAVVMNTTRQTGYRRLVEMENGGHVHRIGESVSTRWLIGRKT